MKRSILLAVAPLALSVDCSVAAAREAASGPATATSSAQLVEVAWTDADKAETKLALALPLAKSCSAVELERDKRWTKLNICRLSPDGDPPLLQFSVERADMSALQKRVMNLHATVRMNRDGSVVIGRFSPAEAATELLATLR